MYTVADRAQLAVMSDETRGAAIQRRLDALGIGDREWYEKTGIDRKTLRRAVDMEPRVRPSTYVHIENALSRLEAMASGGQQVQQVQPVHEPEIVTFRLSGNFGVDVAVSGPVANIDELRETVERLIRDMGDAPKD